MSINYPLFAFEKDDKSMHLIEDESSILHRLETIDIKNDEYFSWEARGDGVRIIASVGAFKSKLESVTSCPASFPIQDGFKLLAGSLGLSQSIADGAPMEVWQRIQTQIWKAIQKELTRGTG